MELYLQHFFCRIHNVKKPYNIISFNTTEKALRGKEDTANIRRPSLIAEKREREKERDLG